MKIYFKLIVVLCFTLTTGLAQVNKNKVLNLGAQVKKTVLQGSAFLKDSNGTLIVYTVLAGSPARLLGFNTNTGELIDNFDIPGIKNSWDLCVSSDGILFIAGSDGHLYSYGSGSGRVSDLGQAIQNESFIFDIVAGKNGDIFGGTYPNAKIFKYNRSGGFITLGRDPVVRGEKYVRSIEILGDNLFAGIGSHANLIAININSGEKTPILPSKYKNSSFVFTLSMISTVSKKNLLFSRLTSDEGNKTLIFDPISKTFLQEIPEIDVQSIIPVPFNNNIYYSSKNKYYSRNLDNLQNSETLLISSIGSILGSYWNSSTNEIISFTTQGEIISYNPRLKQKQVKKIAIPTSSSAIHSLALGPKGKLWSGGYLGGGNAEFDPSTGNVRQYAGLGQTESMSYLGNNIYIGIYPKSRIYKYDTSQPWSIKNSNPKLIMAVAGQDRPVSSTTVDKYSLVYFGTVPSYGKIGGELIEISDKTNSVKIYKDIVKGHSITSLDCTGDLLFGGTSVYGGAGSRSKSSSAAIFIWDIQSKKVISLINPLLNATTISAISFDKVGNLWGVADNFLFLLDIKSKKVIKKITLFPKSELKNNFKGAGIVQYSDKTIYVSSNNGLFSIDRSSLMVKKLQSNAENLIKGQDGNLYFINDNALKKFNPN